jgi:hypothetical protein|tara:strand:- start:132 stop:314 length:183 start_codon:yes stop_codon:yes gene_type:complete
MAELEQPKAEEKKSDAPPVCQGCVIWGKFGKNCFYYWELKKHCTMWTVDWDEAASRQQSL